MRRYRSLKRKKNNNWRWLFLGLGLAFLLASLVVGLKIWSNFKAIPEVIPTYTSLNGIPLGGLSPEEAVQRINTAYSLPVELRYNQARMQFTPAELGFTIDAEAILAQLDGLQPKQGFWSSLWGANPEPEFARELQLVYSIDETLMSQFLNQIFSLRYDQPPSAPIPVLYTTNFTPGQPGFQVASLAETIGQVTRALLSPTERIVGVSVSEKPALPLDWHNLEAMLRQVVLLEKFDGLAELYLQDLQSGQTMHFALLDHQDVPVDVAYSAASTIKIPIMVSTMRRIEEPHPSQALNWMQQMIAESLNPPADGLMKAYMDNNNGPLMVTADLRDLGYQNTFLAGYFDPGSPLLERITTPANSRRDIYLDPDFYNQTVPSEAGDLLARIYRCATGDEQQLFPGQVTPNECALMLDYLKGNKILALLEAGLPPEATIAHKHGWTNEIDGLIHTMSDSAVVFTPTGDYVLVIFAHTQEQFLYDPANRLFARLSQSIYNAYNPDNQAAWYEN
ncbi:MAG: serine hydrolase [Anaerolineaceae bacterium]|nr:serine hydrolase [Anaerolineaceae bacterium]MDD4043013.1 serine hydrolase [Anaerolineaceae bacterium]